jgi:hypothetical protein
MGNPFTNFWFDDNWLSRYMSQAYFKNLPYGLSEYEEFTRWRILGGPDVYWKPYGSDYFDTLALDGLYYITVGDLKAAGVKFNRILDKAGTVMDHSTKLFTYP